MRICSERGSGFKCTEKAVDGYGKCKWHLAASRVHRATDAKFERHIRNFGTSIDLDEVLHPESADDYSEDSKP